MLLCVSKTEQVVYDVFDRVLKKTEVKLELLTGVDMFLMIEKSIRGGICHTNTRTIMINKESSCLKYWDVNNLYNL